MLRIELVEKLDEKPVAAAALELRTDGQIDLSRESPIFSLELLDQILVQRDGDLPLGRGHTRSVPE